MSKISKICICFAGFLLILNPVCRGESARDFFDDGIKAFQQGDFQTAVDLFTVLIDQAPSNAKVYKNRGVAYMGLKYYDSAISDLNRAIELDPELEGIYSNLGAAWHYKNNYAKAIENYDIEISKRPNVYSTYFNRAISKTELEDYDGALEDLAVSIDLKPDNYWAVAYKGDVHMKLEQVNSARASYETAVGLDPDNLYARNKLAELDEVHTDKNGDEGGADVVQLDADTGAEENIPVGTSVQQDNLDMEERAVSMAAPHENAKIALTEGTEVESEIALPKSVQGTENTAEEAQEEVVFHEDDDGSFTVQTGAFLVEKNAEQMVDELAKKGFVSRVFKLMDTKNRYWHMVRIGRFTTKAEAESLSQLIIDKHGMDAVVAHVGRF